MIKARGSNGRFRMNAARALLMPGIRGARRRTPFWLQRLRAKELLAATRGYEDFPILVETYRECLRDVLDMEHCEEVLRRIAAVDMPDVTRVAQHVFDPRHMAAAAVGKLGRLQTLEKKLLG